VRRQLGFMRAVFASGTRALFLRPPAGRGRGGGGGTVRANRRGYEAGFARRITRTAAGHGHPLMAGRLKAYDAPAVHSDDDARTAWPGIARAARDRSPST
jgi:GMP synthase (glutamine-hydrolysing)